MASESILPKIGLGFAALVSLLGFIFFCVCMSAYEHLGPDDQVVTKSAIGKSTEEGPKSHQFNPFKENTWRKATLVNSLQFAVIQNELTADLRHVGGPHLLFLSAYEELLRVESKLLLEKHEYVRLVNNTDGKERIVRGPTALVPRPMEVWNRTEQAVMVDHETAILVMNRATGMQRLVMAPTDIGMFIPHYNEEVVEVRKKNYILTHEAVVVRTAAGNVEVIQTSGAGGGSGGAFFLQPYYAFVTMYWSDFSDASLAKSSAETREKVPVTRIDLRVRKAFYSYSVRSSDNVKLQLDGSVFWQITDVQRMVAATSDPEGDLWYHARSSIIQAVSNVTLNTFMSNFNAIVLSAFTGASSDTFYIERGIELQSIELTSYECIDTDTAIVLQEIIRESTYRRNRLIMQGSEDDVRKEKLKSDIMIEGKRTALLETLADNNLLIARTSGETDGARTAKSISSFIDGLNLSLPELDDRVSLYKHHNALESSKNDTTNLATGTANLYVAPKDMNLKLSMPGGL